MLRFDSMHDSIYMVSGSSEHQCAHHPDVGSLPWPVVLALCSNSKKQIFAPAKPSRKSISESLVDFENRLKWAASRRNRGISIAPLVKRRVRRCREQVTAGVVAFSAAVKRLVINRTIGLRGRRVCLPGYVRFTRRWLQANSLRAEVSDKDGVFVLLHSDLRRSMVLHELLNSNIYRPVGPGNLEGVFRSVKANLFATARKAEKFCVPWGRELKSLASQALEANLLCKLQITVKTHKSPVKVRLVHSSTNSCFNGLGGALNQLISPLLSRVEHLCLSSEDVVKKLAGIVVGRRAMLLKLDIKDFYLTGVHSEIAQGIASAFEDRATRVFVRSALELILDSQYVSCEDSCPDTVFKVQTGSGIGMRHAGAAADLFFYLKVEKTVLAESSELGLVRYLRFRDDLLAVVSDIPFAPRFFQRIREVASSYCVVGRDLFSLVSVPFLDLTVFKTAPERESSLLSWRPYIKPTARHVPLSTESLHPPSVHRSWPKAEMLRMTRRSATSAMAVSWRSHKLQRFQHFMLSPSVLQDCRTWRARSGAEVAKHWCSKPSLSTKVRLVLPFRAELSSLPAELRHLAKLWRGQLLFETGLDVEPCVCWSKAGASLLDLVRGRMERRR
jgi:hypothetical protein